MPMNRGFFLLPLAFACAANTPCPAAPAREAQGADARRTEDRVPASPNEDGHILISPIGDRIRGTLVSFDSEGPGLVWRYGNAGILARFRPEQVGQILLPTSEAVVRREPSFFLELADNGALAGDLVCADASNVVVDTWYAGRLRVARNSVLSIARTEGRQRLYEGPNEADEWQSEPKPRIFRSGPSVFVENGSLVILGSATAFKNLGTLPEHCEFRFTVVAPQGRHFCFTFFAGKIGRDGPRQGYRLLFNGDSASLEMISGDAGRSPQQRFFTVTPAAKPQTEYIIRASRKTGAVSLSVDGRENRVWKAGAVLDNTCNSIAFTSLGSSGLDVRDIRVARWNGLNPPPAQRQSGTTNTVVMFMNGDVLTAASCTITGAIVAVTTSFGVLPVPMDRIGEISFPAPDTNACPSATGTFHLVFPDGGRIPVSSLKVSGKEVLCRGESLGNMTFPLSGLRGIERLSTRAIESYVPTPLDNPQIISNPLDTTPRLPNPLNDVRVFGKGGGL